MKCTISIAPDFEGTRNNTSVSFYMEGSGTCYFDNVQLGSITVVKQTTITTTEEFSFEKVPYGEGPIIILL